MFVRVNTVTGAQNIDDGVTFLREKVLPEVKGHKGFKGMTASANRSTGDFGILGLWDTLEDLKASDSAVSKIRQETIAIIGGEVSVAIMEQAVGEVTGSRNLVGCPLRLVRAKMDPSKVDETIAFFRSDVLPELKAAKGFQAVRFMVDRTTGDGATGTIWADEESMRSIEPAAKERYKAAAARGVQISEPTYRTVLFSHLV